MKKDRKDMIKDLRTYTIYVLLITALYMTFIFTSESGTFTTILLILVSIGYLLIVYFLMQLISTGIESVYWDAKDEEAKYNSENMAKILADADEFCKEYWKELEEKNKNEQK